MSSNCPSQEVIVQPTDSRTNIHLEALSRDFLKMLDESSNCDLEITCEDKTFKAHRIVLGARSTVFSAMLKSNMIEGETGQINVEYTKSTTFQNFLCYLYSGMLPKLDIETAKQLYEVGDKYAVEELKKACSEFLFYNLCEDNACELLVLADRHSDQEFRKNVIAYIVEKNIPKRDKGWSDFCENHSKLAIEALNLYIQKKCPN